MFHVFWTTIRAVPHLRISHSSAFLSTYMYCIIVYLMYLTHSKQIQMSVYAIGRSPASPLIRTDPIQLRARTLADLGGSFCIGQTSTVPNTEATYRMRSFPYRTFRQSRLDDVYYPDNYFHYSSQFRPFPVHERYDRRDHQSVPYTFWTRGNMDCLYHSDQPDLYRRSYEPYRDDYSYKVWSAPRRNLLRD